MDEGTPGKVCTQCKTWKPLDEYHKGHAPDGRLWECKTCKNARARAARLADPEKFRASNKRYRDQNPDVARNALMLHRYGITRARYDEMLTDQDGLCAACGQPETRCDEDGTPYLLAVDHDHRCCPAGKRSCGRCVRELLCRRCNTCIGAFDDDADLMLAAVRYLLRHNDSEGGLTTRDHGRRDPGVGRLVDPASGRPAYGAPEADSTLVGPL